MKQKLHYLLFVIALFSFSMITFAQSFVIGDLKYYVHSTAQKEVTCTGFSSSSRGLFLDIPNTVEYEGIKYSVSKIGARAFQYTRLQTIKHLPDELKEIGEYAFYYCEYASTSLTIPKTVEKIGQFAFYGAKGISLYLPENSALVSLGDGAFEESGMYSAVIPSAFTSIPGGMFRNCKNLKSVKIPSTVKAIGEVVFYGCNALESIELPDGIETIGGYAFAETSISGKFSIEVQKSEGVSGLIIYT